MFILGKLCDASARYERAIQEEPNEIGHHKVTGCNVSSFMGKLMWKLGSLEDTTR